MRFNRPRIKFKRSPNAEIKFDTENVYYPVTEKEYIIDMILNIVWNVALISVAIYLAITFNPWWICLVILGSTPNKIAKRSRD